MEWIREGNIFTSSTLISNPQSFFLLVLQLITQFFYEYTLQNNETSLRTMELVRSTYDSNLSHI
jgi:hypothetical protein